jgi:hypothetical protein
MTDLDEARQAGRLDAAELLRAEARRLLSGGRMDQAPSMGRLRKVEQLANAADLIEVTVHRYAQCDETCTSDCGACKGAGPPWATS